MAIPLGFGFGDLVKAIELSWHIYIICFNEEGASE